MRKVANRYRLTSVLLTHPVRIWQVDADSSRRIEVTTNDSSSNDLRRDTFNLFLLKLGIDRRMVFKPLCILAEALRTLGRLQILEVDNRLP